MKLRQLQLLLTVIESGGYAPAGKLLNISHSAIHRQIRMLEQELECHLLAPSGRSVKATEPGRLVADVALQIRQQIAEARRHANSLNSLQMGRLRIGTTRSILVSFLPAILQCFSKKFPRVRFHLVTESADDLIENVLKRKLDVGILLNPADLSRPIPKVETEILYREESDQAIGKGHFLAKQDQIALDQLAPHSLTTHQRRPEAGGRILALQNLWPTVIREPDKEDSTDTAIHINKGLGLRSPRRLVNGEIRCFRIPSGTIQYGVGIVLQRRNCIPRVITEFIRMCREVRMPSEP